MSNREMLCTVGKFDIPIIQLQPQFTVDLLNSNIALFGAAMSGKTTFLRTLINSLHKQYNEREERIFILDFGGALFQYEKFPLVAAYFDNSNEEYVKRVFKILDSVLKENIAMLDGKNFNDEHVPKENRPMHTTFIIDNLNAFLDEPRYAGYQEKLSKLCRDGLSKGITIVVTAADTKGTHSYMGNFRQKIAFELPKDKYGDIFNEKVGDIGNNPGHGFANVTVPPEGVTGTFHMNRPYEVQCIFPYKDEQEQNKFQKANTEAEFINQLHKKFQYSDGTYRKQVKKYQTFPKELTRECYEKLLQEKEEALPERFGKISIGLDYVDFMSVTLDLKKTGAIAIYGKKEFGKTNLLNLILQGFVETNKNIRIVFLDDGRKQLEVIYNRLKNQVDCVLFDSFQEVKLKINNVAESGNRETRPQTQMKTENRTGLPGLGMGSANKLNSTSILPGRRISEDSSANETANGQGISLEKESSITRKLSPLQQFYTYINENYITVTRETMKKVYGYEGESIEVMKSISRIPVCQKDNNPFTVFVIQSKQFYLCANERDPFKSRELPQLVSLAEEKGYCFIFSDVQKINDGEQNSYFNSVLSKVFLLDNIAEFASERGQKTVFGDMDNKALKEDYARCELGDGYFYDVEADNLKKMKFIKYEGE